MDIERLDIQKTKASQFRKKGIESVEDLLNFLPRNYIDYSHPKTYKNFVDGEYTSVIATVISISYNDKKNYWKASVVDESYTNFDIYWFGNVYTLRQMRRGLKHIFCGRVSVFGTSYTMTNPIFSEDIDSLLKVFPVYSKINGMSDMFLKSCINKALNHFIPSEIIEQSILDKYNVCNTSTRMRMIHEPKTLHDVEIAKKRIVFDELFHLAIEMERNSQESTHPSDIVLKTCFGVKQLIDTLPFSPTDGEDSQLETVRKIIRKINKGNLTTSLVQGDVGCGKTLVAVLTMVAFAENNYQSVLLAPTTVLATQHYNEITSYTDKVSIIRPILLTGNMKAKEKREAIKKIASGEANFIVGTHSLLSDGIEFANLGLCIIDEEHRFGVSQRNRISEKITGGIHVISMSATPIPRSLGLSLYGDSTDIYTISKMPNGRKPVETSICTDSDVAYEKIYSEIQNGHQAYIICPLIDESTSERLEGVMSVEETYNEVIDYFASRPDVKVAVINGKMKQDDVTNTIKDFADKKYNIVISTTIIEVGVNVPNATCILIKNAERFGLAQLHQLRGRVGRGKDQSYCILCSEKEDVERLQVMTETTNGFKISEADIKLRGVGDLLGTKQSGNLKNVMLMLENQNLYASIKKDVKEIFSNKHRYDYYYNAGF